MPNKLPRINVTVTEEQKALLFELADLQGTSASGILRKMLDEATPLLRDSVPQLRKINQDQDRMLDYLAGALSLSLDEIGVAIGETQLDIEDVIERRTAGAAPKRAGKRRGGAAPSGPLKAV